MIYLDYSATTPADKSVLETYVRDNEVFFGNPNSNHKLGLIAKNEIDKASKEILDVFGLDNHEVVFTSGASEANNLAIKGIAFAKQMRGKHLITSNFEHSSVFSCFNYLSKQGFSVDVAPFNENGIIDLEKLERLITDHTTLISIGAVNSETGILQDLKALSEVIRKYPHVTFHSDLTQAVGKINIDYSLVDMFSFSGHKIYGLKGVGALVVKSGTKLIPQIHGGKAQSIHRSGTPATPLILSLRNALVLAYQNFDEKLKSIYELHDYLLSKVIDKDDIVVNSNLYSIPQIVNLSFTKIFSGDLHEQLSDKGIYISTATACASGNPVSLVVKKLTGSYELAETSVRVSLSHLSTKEDIYALIKACEEIIKL